MDGLGFSYLSYPINLNVRRKDSGQYVCHCVTQQKAPWGAGEVGMTLGLVKLLGLISISTELNDDSEMKSAESQVQESLQDQSSSLFL